MRFVELIRIMKFVISKHHVRGDFSSESPNYASATHAAEFVQGAVPLGITQISWGSIGLCGVLFVSQNNLRFRTLETIVPATHLLKITARLLLTYYSISDVTYYFACEVIIKKSEIEYL